MAKTLEKEVLFQKIGNTWFIFTEVDGQLCYSKMPEGMDPRKTKLEVYSVIEEHMKKVAGEKTPFTESNPV